MVMYGIERNSAGLGSAFPLLFLQARNFEFRLGRADKNQAYSRYVALSRIGATVRPRREPGLLHFVPDLSGQDLP
jgi:hypothetical protein